MSLLFNPIEDCFDLVGLTEASADSIYLRQDQNLADLIDASAARTNLGLEIGVDVQAWDANLDSISLLGTAADRMLYTTAINTWAELTTASYGRSLLSAANDVAARILIDAQQADATLTALAGLTISANSLIVGTGADAFTITTFGANTFPARSSTGNIAAKTVTDFALTLLDDTTAADARTTLGLVAGGDGDIWVEKAGDTMTGQLVIDINSDTSAIKIVQNATQTTFPIQLRNSADTAYTSAIDANGRFRSVASVSSGIAWMGGDLSTTTYMTLNHTSAAATFTNLTGTWSFEGVATNEIVFNNLQADVNFRVESDNNQNALHVDAGLFSGDGGIGIGTNAQPDNRVYVTLSTGEDINAYGLHVVASQTTSRAKTLRGLAVDVSHSGTATQSGVNGLEFNLSSSNAGTVNFFQGVSANLTVGTTSTVSNAYLFRAFNPTVSGGTLSNFAAFRTETIADNSAYYAFYSRAGRSVFNDDGTSYSDFLIKGDNDNNNFIVDVSADAVGVGIAAPTAKLHVDQTSTTGAKPVLYLDQADVSEQMIQFETTIGTGNAIEAVGAKSLTTTHFIKVTIPGSLTRYFPVGTIA